MKSNHNVEHISMLTPDTIKESVMKRHEELSSILSNIHSRISHAPDGSLRTAQKANGCQYYHKVKVGDTKGKYIKKNNYNLAIKLAQKDYDLKVETCLIKELDFLQRILDQYRPDKIQHIYDSLNNSRKQIVTPVYVSDGIAGIFCIIHNTEVLPYVFLSCTDIKAGKVRMSNDPRLQLQRTFISIRNIITIKLVSNDYF